MPKAKHNELYAQFLTACQELEDVQATVIPIEEETRLREAVLSLFSHRPNEPSSLFS